MSEDEFQAWQAKRPRKQPIRLTGAQLRQIQLHMPHVRRCRQKLQRPRSVPRVVLERIIALKLC